MRDYKGEILAEKPRGLAKSRRLHWFALLFSIPLFGIVAAFGIAPQTQIEPPLRLQTIVEDLELPVQLAEGPGESLDFWKEERIQRGDTLGSILSRLGVEDPAASSFLLTSNDAPAMRHLIPGRTIRARTTEQGELLALRYLDGAANEFAVDRLEDGFSARELTPQFEQQVHLKAGEIQSSLFAATDAAEIPDAIAIQIAEIFSSDIDFHRDLRKGDRFMVVYEVAYHDGTAVRAGRVLAAEFVNDGRVYRAVYFQAPDGSGGYYTPDGKSMRKAFLRSPLEFSRISSGFTNARFHPVLKQWRAHRGVDYAAPIGTRARATADGRVSFIGNQGAYGNLIILQHHGSHSTAYAHLSRFAKGLRVGSRVSQGDVIGFVGMTGLATGPHLHYEFRINGEQRDPLRVAMPEAPPIAVQNRAAFQEVAKAMTARLALLDTVRLARAN